VHSLQEVPREGHRLLAYGGQAGGETVPVVPGLHQGPRRARIREPAFVSAGWKSQSSWWSPADQVS